MILWMFYGCSMAVYAPVPMALVDLDPSPGPQVPRSYHTMPEGISSPTSTTPTAPRATNGNCLRCFGSNL